MLGAGDSSSDQLDAALMSLVVQFDDGDPLRIRLVEVLRQLPMDVIQDFAGDVRFSITKMNHSRGDSLKLMMALPSPSGQGSRCVVLKERLATCEHQFGLYVIAHELAHAYLRNGPWKGYTDIEDAADALAAHWGFSRCN
jgi:hypothetical protein